MIPLCLMLFMCVIPIDENTFLIIVFWLPPREDQMPHVDTFGALVFFWSNPYPWYFDPPTHDNLTPLPMVYKCAYPWYFDPTMVYRTHFNPLSMLFWPHDHGILTPHPWYFDSLPMVGWSLYPWYFDPYPRYVEPDNHVFWPPTHGISNPLTIVFWPLPMVYRPPIHGYLTPLPMAHWTLYQWYFDPPTHGISNIDASYQVSVHFAEEFQRKRCKCEKLADDGRRTSSDGKRSCYLWQGELKSIIPGWLKNKHSTNKNRQHTFWRHWVSCFYCVLPMNKKHTRFKEPSNEHFYRAWFQMA